MGTAVQEERHFKSTLRDDGVQLSGQLRPDVFDVITAGRRADVTFTLSNGARSPAPEAVVRSVSVVFSVVYTVTTAQHDLISSVLVVPSQTERHAAVLLHDVRTSLTDRADLRIGLCLVLIGDKCLFAARIDFPKLVYHTNKSTEHGDSLTLLLPGSFLL